MSDYKPTEHDGLKQDGTPDKRVGTGGKFFQTPLLQDAADRMAEFAYGKVDPHKAGHEGGKTSGSGGGGSSETASSGDGDYKPTENDGLRKDGKPDQRVKGN
ncbi:hypothetical protein E4U42_003875 [Claviceps africana]|uniref:Uncharacterized protein n=1 Tax=Claviceps africana TaxID=83212 RepID=A0A8K0J760_9HYPO|nr:hypothetical protein E4U42_003875 [Claviceps africana]